MTRNTHVDSGAESKPRGAGIRWNPGYIAAALLLIFGFCAALSIDVVRTGFGIKGDEATYVAMAMSAAYDADLVYEARDIRRFFRVYQGGPSGIFLKRGGGERDRRNRLYFGKAFIYSVLAAPFVRVAGLNGMLLFHVVLLAGMLLAAYVFLAARSPDGIALAYAAAFFGVSIVPLHALFLSSDFFHVAGVSFAYFLWFYKDVAPPGHGRWAAWLRGPGSDIAAAVILGLATFSKPTHVFLILPPLVLALNRRRPLLAVYVAAAFATTVAAGFAINAGITGEWNYQGGNRRTFSGRFPFESPEAAFDNLDNQCRYRRSGDDRRVPADPRDEPAVLSARSPLRLPAVLFSGGGRDSAVCDDRQRPPPLAVGDAMRFPADGDRTLHVHAAYLVRGGRPPRKPLLLERLSGVAVPDAAARLGRAGGDCLGRRCALHGTGARQSVRRSEAALSHRRERSPASPAG